MSRGPNFGLQPLGVGVSLRQQHVAELLQQDASVRWCELCAEDFVRRGGLFTEMLEALAARAPLATYGRSLSLGGADPLDADWLRGLRALCGRIRSPWHSECLAASRVDGVHLNQPLPPIFSADAARRLADRVRTVQYEIERPLLLENVAYYLRLSRDGMSEAEFLAEVAELADCGLALDVSNVVLNAVNHGYDPYAFVESLPLQRVGLLHLGAFEARDELLLDTDDGPIAEQTWDLYRYVLERVSSTSAAVQWRVNSSSIERLLEEARVAQGLMDEAADATSVV